MINNLTGTTSLPISTILLAIIFESVTSRNVFYLYANECLFLFTARGRRVRHGVEFRDTGRAEHSTHARTLRPLSTQLTGKCLILIQSNGSIASLAMRSWLRG